MFFARRRKPSNDAAATGLSAEDQAALAAAKTTEQKIEIGARIIGRMIAEVLLEEQARRNEAEERLMKRLHRLSAKDLGLL